MWSSSNVVWQGSWGRRWSILFFLFLGISRNKKKWRVKPTICIMRYFVTCPSNRNVTGWLLTLHYFQIRPPTGCGGSLKINSTHLIVHNEIIQPITTGLGTCYAMLLLMVSLIWRTHFLIYWDKLFLLFRELRLIAAFPHFGIFSQVHVEMKTLDRFSFKF